MAVVKQRYPIGQQDFAGIREEGRVYIDKTALIYELVHDAKYIFLSRPRRFGKSLLLSTLRYYFEGRKDLFEGLKIMYLETVWRRHPVLHLELSRIDQLDPDSLKNFLNFQFSEWEEKYEVSNVPEGFSARFCKIITQAAEITGNKVVILVDEYDNPLINTLDKDDIHESNRTLLKSIYSNLKAMDSYIRFGFITGITRFSNTSIFSGLNNLTDISLDNNYSAICGFTPEEIREFMWPGVEGLAEKLSISSEEALQVLKNEYDGYHFSDELIDVYNPFSLLNCLYRSRIDNYWINSGVPEFLVKRLRANEKDFNSLFNSSADPMELATVDVAFQSPVALMFQTGYLTIKSYDFEDNVYKLGIPNREVDRGLFRFLLGSYLPSSSSDGNSMLRDMSRSLKEGKPDRFFELLQSFLAPISPQMDGHVSELAFERTLYIIFHMLGFYVHAEQYTSNGRIDLLIETQDYVYVIELKRDKSAEEALKQIDEKGYALAWKFDDRRLFKIGVNFSTEKRNITAWKIAE